MEMDQLWSSVLTIAIAAVGWSAKTIWSELQRVQILINKTREELGKEYATKQDVSATKQEIHMEINRVLDRIERLDLKLDRLIESHQWDGTSERRQR